MAYTILPLRFERLVRNDYLIVNAAGEHYFIGADDYDRFVKGKLDPSEKLFLDLKGKHFLTDTNLSPVVNLLATKYRTKKEFLRSFTSLHMVVVTARCNHNCLYCHASSGAENEMHLDMNVDIARNTVDLIFQSPSPTIKIEFQGGEPLLNFSIIRYIVKYAKKINKRHNKDLEFVIATNLAPLNKSHIRFIKKHAIVLSTSLDGPQHLHDKCRIMRDSGKSSYSEFVNKLQLARKHLGDDCASALLTISKYNIDHLREVIDEYVGLGFSGIFLRSLNPYGRAVCEEQNLGYPMHQYIDKYKKALDYIIELNVSGTFFVEYNAMIYLTKILTPYSTGFVDVQFPSGAGIMGAIYDYDGVVYPTDESRMLARVGDNIFKLGHVERNSYEEIFGGDLIRQITGSSCAEILPSCCDCAVQDYCGSDPVRYYEESGDIVGHRPTSGYCRKNHQIISHLMTVIRENSQEVMDVFWSWITHRSVDQIRRL